MRPVAVALLLSLSAFASPDGGTDTPYWQPEPAGAVLQTDAVVATPQTAQAFDIALRTAQADAAAGTDKAVAVGLITGAVGLILGAVLGGVVVAVVKR